MRPSSFPELPRGAGRPSATSSSGYWPLEELGRWTQSLDAIIVTGTEPRAARLTDEPYWRRFGELLEWAREHTLASILVSPQRRMRRWRASDGIQRQRACRRSAPVIYEHSTLASHPLL